MAMSCLSIPQRLVLTVWATLASVGILDMQGSGPDRIPAGYALAIAATLAAGAALFVFAPRRKSEEPAKQAPPAAAPPTVPAEWAELEQRRMGSKP